jgi:hypothetical protein
MTEITFKAAPAKLVASIDREAYVTTQQLAVWLGVSDNTARGLIKRAQDPLPDAFKLHSGVNATLYFKRAEIKAWLKRNPDYPKQFKPRLPREDARPPGLDLRLARAFLIRRSYQPVRLD